MSAPPLSLPLFLLAASLVVPGALLLAGARWLWRKWRARKFNGLELRCADEQAKFLPRNPSRDEAKRDLRAAELRDEAGARGPLRLPPDYTAVGVGTSLCAVHRTSWHVIRWSAPQNAWLSGVDYATATAARAALGASL